MSDLKKLLHQHCINYVQQRIDAVDQAIHAAQQAANDETKSSAGDKYETGRAMMQQDTDRNMGQLNEAKKLMALLNRISTASTSPVAEPGSCVFTNNGNFYIAISAGTFTLGDRSWFAVSKVSPIGAKLAGCKAGDSFTLNGKTYQVQDVK